MILSLLLVCFLLIILFFLHTELSAGSSKSLKKGFLLSDPQGISFSKTNTRQYKRHHPRQKGVRSGFSWAI
ncbi:8-kDa hydrophobic protein a [Citrus virus B]|nr:8-kDa hydrophobic protein a [Citrus virus B]